MIVRSFANGFELIDFTEEINIIPNLWGTINELGIFAEESVAEHIVGFDKVTKDFAPIGDRIRGARGNVSKDYAREIHTFPIPHFPLIDYIVPQDIQGKRAYGELSAAETLAAVRARKMERIANDHAVLLEVARAQALSLGTAYAPNGTVNQNWYSEFGKTPTSINFPFSTPAADIMGVIETVIAAIQDNGGMVQLSGIVFLCSPSWFASLISHSSVKTAYQYYTSGGQAQPLRDRLAPVAGNSRSLGMHRQFYFGGVTFVEMRDAFNGVPLVPANTAIALPTGTEFFKTFFGPANKFGLTNTLGERMYLFEYPSMDGSEIKLESESNHISALLRPELVISLTKS